MSKGVELVGDESDSNSDDEIDVLIEETKRDKPKCWRKVLKYLLLVIATVLIAAMCIQLWASYGTVITERAFPPRLVGAGKFCPEGQVSSYRMAFHQYANETLHVNISQTNVLAMMSPNKNFTISDDGQPCLAVFTDECVSILLYTI